MTETKMPTRIQGEWIWKNSLLNHPDSFLLMRKEFVCSTVNLDTTLWISANCAYQLFINGRFVGFGPRAHQNCGVSYVDMHEVTYYLESGINVIAALVYYNADQGGHNKHSPGLWCQMEAQGKLLLCSDQTWVVREGNCYCAPRARLSKDQGLSQFFNADDSPLNWTTPVFLTDAQWKHPDYSTIVGDDFGSKLEPHPLAPPGIAVENPVPRPFARGRLVLPPNWTQVTFEEADGNGLETYAANTFLFSEVDEELPALIYSDDPMKFFCNNRLVLNAAEAMGTEVKLPLRAGWNRLLLVQNPGRHAMGMVMMIPSDDGREFWFGRTPEQKAAEGWNIVGPLKLSLEEATPSLKFERLVQDNYVPELEYLTDPDAYLSQSRFEEETLPADEEEAKLAWSRPLRTGDYVLYRLDMVRYGFVRVTLEATAGDLVDITIGCRRTGNGFISAGKGVRGTGTIRCRNARNVYLTFIPTDCFYIMISVRHASSSIKVLGISFEELTRNERQETTFRCSDELLNQFWEIGKQTLRRSAAFVPLAESRADNDCYMLDAYIDAVNMSVTFGDYEYASARLRQFLDAQLENGDIPALTFGSRHASQVHQLFFLPVWIYYNYRFTANITRLKETIPNLDLTLEYFEAMIDENTGLLVDTETRFSFDSRISSGEFRAGEIPTYINALFCRFLLSAAEIYRTIEDEGKANHCYELAGKVAEELRNRNFDPACSLFCRWSLESERMPDHNLFANFCAMFGGVLPLSSFEYFFYSFFNYDPPFDRSDESRHPYFHFLFMEMMFALGQKEWPFRYFRDYWSKRMCPEANAWRVDFDHADPAPTKFSEGSCVSPNIFLVREILGIRIAEAGHSVIYFNPAFHQVDWAESVFPMARGRLKVKWAVQEDGSLDVTLDSSFPVKILPEMSHKQLANTVFRLGEKVTLLNPTPDYDIDDDEGDDSRE